MFLKFKIEKAPNVLYKCGPRHFEVEQSPLSLPLLKVYDCKFAICVLRQSSYGLKKWKMRRSLIAR